MTELLIIKTANADKLKIFLAKNHIEHQIIYTESLTEKKPTKKDKLREYIEMKNLPENPTPSQLVKYELCEKILGYQEDNNLTDKEIAEKIELSLNETEDILFCRIAKVGFDNLINAVSKLFSPAEIKVIVEQKKDVVKRNLLSYQVYNLRDFAVKGQVDDYPYGGGPGMLLKIEPLVRALTSIQEVHANSYLILISPQGKTFTQKDQISIGDFITMGGEIPALAITDALIRAIPNAIQAESYQQETFHDSQLDFATYTRPEVFEGLKVPEVLLSGHHEKIRKWRVESRQQKTHQREKKYKNKRGSFRLEVVFMEEELISMKEYFECLINADYRIY
ncbi:7994_t:CDS:2 [Entrophospora sp. SA101]|nr:7994_t:CDS:2 [Entrophospora sp. SA101]